MPSTIARPLSGNAAASASASLASHNAAIVGPDPLTSPYYSSGALIAAGVGYGTPLFQIGLYLLLAEDDSDSAHGRYNALIRRLVSFERALECAS